MSWQPMLTALALAPSPHQVAASGGSRRTRHPGDGLSPPDVAALGR